MARRRRLDQKHGCEDQGESEPRSPSGHFPEIEERENHEDSDRDDFLDNFQLRCRELAGADPVGGHLQRVFRQGDQPAHQNGQRHQELRYFK